MGRQDWSRSPNHARCSRRWALSAESQTKTCDDRFTTDRMFRETLDDHEAMMIWARLAGDAGTLAHWLWVNRDKFPVLKKTGEFVSSALSDPHGAVHRVGNTIIFGQPDGGSKILGFIEQAPSKLNDIDVAVRE